MSDDTAALILALATENAELHAALAEAQDLLVETAVDAGELHARIEELQAELTAVRAERDAWRTKVEQHPDATSRPSSAPGWAAGFR